jgi:hypothetical protein
VGATAYGYFWDKANNEYHLMYSGSVSTSDFNLGLMVQNNSTQGGSFNVAFDNLIITADSINGLKALNPSIFLLLLME